MAIDKSGPWWRDDKKRRAALAESWGEEREKELTAVDELVDYLDSLLISDQWDKYVEELTELGLEEYKNRSLLDLYGYLVDTTVRGRKPSFAYGASGNSIDFYLGNQKPKGGTRIPGIRSFLNLLDENSAPTVLEKLPELRRIIQNLQSSADMSTLRSIVHRLERDRVPVPLIRLMVRIWQDSFLKHYPTYYEFRGVEEGFTYEWWRNLAEAQENLPTPHERVEESMKVVEERKREYQKARRAEYNSRRKGRKLIKDEEKRIHDEWDSVRDRNWEEVRDWVQDHQDHPLRKLGYKGRLSQPQIDNPENYWYDKAKGRLRRKEPVPKGQRGYRGEGR